MSDEDDLKGFIHSDRSDFKNDGLSENEMNTEPVEQFLTWMAEAKEGGVNDPYAMCASTVDKEGYPQSRIVYLRDIIDGGFVFYTNYHSAKGKEIDGNGKASLNFHWHGQARQIRIVGTIAKVGGNVSDAYFASRPRESQLGAWGSHQSETLKERSVLIDRTDEYRRKFDGQVVPRPAHWGGYIVHPITIEFWQGRSSRLHDRFKYCRDSDKSWHIKRLSP